MEPLFEHICNGCKYYGVFKGQDVYLCGKRRRTVILRYGSKPAEYRSHLLFCSTSLTFYDYFVLLNGLTLKKEEEAALLEILSSMIKDKIPFSEYEKFSDSEFSFKGKNTFMDEEYNE